jgi:hypothetical protein
MRTVFIAIACLIAGSTFAPAQQSKKLIEFGWDEPDTAFMRQHIAEMEKSPFDGCVFHLYYTDAKGGTGQFIWDAWGKRAFAESDFAKAMDDLKNTPFKKFTHNLLRFNTTPGDVDWFDDYSAILNNARLAAKIAREGKAAGLLFDIEQYNSQLFNYAKQRDAKTKSWAQYAAQAKTRGREVMSAFQEGYPDLVVFMTWAYSLPHAQCGVDDIKLAQVDYGLLKPFLDGMFEAATGKTKIVDGFETSYGYKEAKQFDAIPIITKKTVLPWMPDPQKYLNHMSQGFGLWMDNDWRNKAWNETDFSKNHFTPDEFERSVREALRASDEFVWIYTESPRWWAAPEGKPQKLPAAYAEALRKAAGK